MRFTVTDGPQAPRRASVTLSVTIDLDAVPGYGYHGEDHARHLQRFLTDSMPHYNPTVSIVANDRPRPTESEV